MSKIDELIEELCPDGVEFKKLGDIVTFRRGNGPQKKDLQNTGVGTIHYGQIYTTYGLSTKTTVSFVSNDVAKRSKLAFPNEIIMADTSENDDDLCKSTVWLGDQPIAISNHTLILATDQDPKYLAHFFQSEQFQAQKRRYIIGTKVKTVSETSLSKIEVPVPPLPVQRAIVDILDKFTELEAELEAELVARKKQYEYYRNALLTFDEDDGADVKWVALRDLGTWFGGSTPSKSDASNWVVDGIPWISPKDMRAPILTDSEDHVSHKVVENGRLRLLPRNSIVLVARSSILNHTLPIARLDAPATLNQDMKGLIPDDGCCPEYLHYALQASSERILLKARKWGGSVASLDSKPLMTFEVPVPPIERQEEIAHALRNFHSLTADLSSGLPAELEARRKQYEYYRDRLLTFKEKVA